MKFWFFLCLSFFVYTIVILISEKYEGTFQLESTSEPIYYSACFRLTEMFKNREMIDLNQLNYDLYKIAMSNIAKVNFSSKQIFDLLINKIILKRYFIFKRHVCLRFDDLNGIRSIELFLLLPPKLYAYSHREDSFYKIESQSVSINLIIVQDLEYPFTKCTNKADHFSCLTRCVKSIGQRFSKYFFEGNEEGHVYLMYQMNKTTKDNELRCVESCRNIIPCKFCNFVAQYHIGKQTKTIKVFKAYASLSDFSFWLKFVSLICLILNVSFYQLMYKMIIILASKIEFINAYLVLSRKLITIPNLFLSFYLLTSMSRSYLERRDFPVKREITTTIIQPEVLNLAICVSIFDIIDEDYEYENRTYIEIERILQSRFDRDMVRLQLEFFDKQVEVKWHWISKVIFVGLFRCYLLEMSAIGSSNHNLFFLSRLTIIPKFDNNLIYILTDTIDFNSRSLKFDPRFSLVKRIVTRSKLSMRNKCLDYLESEENCSTRWQCIDRCANKLSFSLYQSIWDDAIINKDDLKKEWPNLRLNSTTGIFFERRHKELWSECEKKYDQLDCTEITFDHAVQVKNPNKIEEYQLDLNYNIISLIEEEPSIIVLVMDLLNSNIVIFGFNFFVSISNAFNYLKIKMKYQKLLVYFICTIGLVNHLWFVWSQIVNSDLIYSQFYVSPLIIDTPDLIFCSEKSNKLKLSNLFDQIVFLDNHTNEWKELKGSGQNELKIERLSFLNQDCIALISNMQYNKDQFEYANGTNILKIYFNKSIVHQQNSSINFLTKTKGTNQFSKILSLLFNDEDEQVFMTIVSHELYELNFHDKFSLIRNPFSLFNGANTETADELLKKAIDKFERRKYFRKRDLSSNQELETLFKEFIKEIKDVNPKLESNYQKKLSINYLNQQRNDKLNQPDFIFGLIYFKRVVHASNSENLTKLILNIMSLLEFWYFVNFLELYVYLYKIRGFFIYLKNS